MTNNKATADHRRTVLAFLRLFLFSAFFFSSLSTAKEWVYLYRAWDQYGNMIQDSVDQQKSYGAALAKIRALGPRWEGAEDIGLVSGDGLYIDIITPIHGIDFYTSNLAKPDGGEIKGTTPEATCLALLSAWGASLVELKAEYPGQPATDYGCTGKKPDNQIIGATLFPGCIPGFYIYREGYDSYGRFIPAGKCMTPAVAQIIIQAVPCPCEELVGNPIQPALGIKQQREAVIPNRQGSGLGFDLRYTSYRSSTPIHQNGWTHRFARRVVFKGSVAQVYGDAETPVRFTYSGSPVLTPQADVAAKLERLTDTSGVLTGWRYTSLDDTVELYDAKGYVQRITNRQGMAYVLAYDSAMRLQSVTDDFGSAITLAYDAAGRLSQLTGVASESYSLDYDANGNLAAIHFPDSKTRTFVYNEAGLAPSATTFPHLLTGIIDENQARYATFGYDADGRAISTEHAGGTMRYVVDYSPSTGSTVTDPLGTARTYGYAAVYSAARSTGIVQPCGTSGCSGTVATAREYNANGITSKFTDYRGNLTTYTYDLTRNLETSRTEAQGTAQARTIATTWHPSYRLPATITEPTAAGSKITTLSYDANGNLTGKSIAVGGATRSWSWTYDSLGRVLTATDPRNNVTTHTYYPNTAAQNSTLANSRGQLATVTNAAGHVTTIAGYNAHGQPTALTDANGLATSLTYDARQRLKTRSVGGETTTYDYDDAGQLTQVTQPDGSSLAYTYDAAHRLTKITDSLGNRIVYTLDNLGNRLQEDYQDPSGALARRRNREYDLLNRLQKDIGGANPAGQITQYAYDANNNLTGTTDPLARTTSQSYDALNRLLQVIDPVNGSAAPTKYEYDAQDNLTKVTDPKNLATTYAYNGFNELITQVSPDTGTSSFTYDASGNLLTKTDARNVTATYTYDNLNRVTSISYPAVGSDAAETVTYTYDTCANGKGRLCSLSDKTGSTVYGYDSHGRTTAKSQTVAGLSQTVGYGYNAAGQLTSVTYPSGAVIGYGYANNRIVSVTVNGTTTLLSQALYQPFGPVAEWVWGNSTTGTPNKHVRRADQDGRLWKIESGNGLDPSVIVYDDASRITALQKLNAGAVDPTKSASYGYDNLDRLTSMSPGAGNPAAALGYSYDPIGNRLTSTVGGASTGYSYGTTSHRLNALTGAGSVSYSYDANGNQTGDGTRTWSYGGNNRPTQVVNGGATTSFGINALGQRVKKSTGAAAFLFVYDEAGRLIGEYDGSGARVREHLWLGDLPVGVLQ